MNFSSSYYNINLRDYFSFKKGIESGYLQVPLLKADIILTIVVMIPNNATAAVKKKFIPGKGKNNTNEIIKYRFSEQ